MIISVVKAQQAAEALGVSLEGLTPDSIKSAFRTKAKECHPDKHGTEKLDQWSQIEWAKACLTIWLDQHPPEAQSDASEQTLVKGDCRACGGTGRIKVGKGWSKYTMQCLMCRGEGTVTPEEIDND